jgi:cytochrome bd-type quinol oxidase subunit 2
MSDPPVPPSAPGRWFAIIISAIGGIFLPIASVLLAGLFVENDPNSNNYGETLVGAVPTLILSIAWFCLILMSGLIFIASSRADGMRWWIPLVFIIGLLLAIPFILIACVTAYPHIDDGPKWEDGVLMVWILDSIVVMAIVTALLYRWNLNRIGRRSENPMEKKSLY